MELSGNLYSPLLSIIKKRTDVCSAKKRLLSSDLLQDKEKTCLKNISLKIHKNDEMYVPYKAQHYLSVGLSAIKCIDSALEQLEVNREVKSILDFPCGYGRVLRFLRAKYPEAEIIGGEREKHALNFCRREFSIKPLVSRSGFSQLHLNKKFDLIWCGSLLTHINEADSIALLKFFHDQLLDSGLCVFTTHGYQSFLSVKKGKREYGLPKQSSLALLSKYEEGGYAFADYPNQAGYGVSLVSHDRMSRIADIAGANWKQIFFLEQGWDHHHDVYGFVKR